MQRRETDAPPPDDSVVDERIASTETLPRGARNVCWMRLIKTSAVLLFLCGLVGAFIYAVNSHDDSATKAVKHDLNNSEPYSVYQNQYSDDGIFIFEVFANNAPYAFNGSSFWYQDHDKKSLYYKMDGTTNVWVFEGRSFWVTLNSNGGISQCKEDPIGYDEYIRQLSLVNMYNRHSEKKQIRGDSEFYIFDGEPTFWKHQNVIPYLTQAYASVKDGHLMEFQSHYSKDTNHGWVSLGYVFENMKADKPPEDVFKNLPAECEAT